MGLLPSNRCDSPDRPHLPGSHPSFHCCCAVVIVHQYPPRPIEKSTTECE